MPDDIENVIFRLGLDGSAYIEGADKLTASTNKLSQAQEAANKKLAELNAEQKIIKKSFDEVTGAIKANEKETTELTKRLNQLKSESKEDYKEFKNLQTALKNIALNTKELGIESTKLKTNLAANTTAIKVQTSELKAAEAASGNFTKGLTKAYSGLRTLANIIPGIGIGGLVALIAGPLVSAFEKLYESITKDNTALKTVNEAFENSADAFTKATTTVNELRINVDLAKKGFIDKQKVVEEYNTSMGKTAGTVKTLDEVEQKLVEHGDAYIQMMFLKAAANYALEKASKAAFDAEEKRRKDEAKAVDLSTKSEVTKGNAVEEETNRQSIERTKRKIALETQAAEKEKKDLLDIAKDFEKQAAEIAKEHKFNFFDDTKDPKPKAPKKAKAPQTPPDSFTIDLKSQRDFEAAKEQISIDALKRIAEDEKNYLALRIFAYRRMVEEEDKLIRDKASAEIEIIDAQAKHEIETHKYTAAQNQAILKSAFYKAETIRIQATQQTLNFEAGVQTKISDLIQKQIDDAYKERLKKEEDFQNSIIALGDATLAKVRANHKTAKKVIDPEDKSVAAYADAVGQVADSVIQFWQAVNDAETKALDYSISLQEKRVDAAQRIADRGNAQYLKQEEDRLTQLNVQRENAARKQLGIDAALQASQVLVGITGAISKIATPGGIGGAETIAEIAIIIGALATGYGLVKSLQGNQPKLFEGTKYLERNGHPSGRDTIPAHLNEGEAVIPTDRNKAYHPTVAAIYDGTVPAEHLNAFVKHYHQIKAVPQPNYERIKDAAELKIGQDGKMTVILSQQNDLMRENNELQNKTLKALKTIGVHVNMDKNGFAMSFLEVAKKIEIDKRV